MTHVRCSSLQIIFHSIQWASQQTFTLKPEVQRLFSLTCSAKHYKSSVCNFLIGEIQVFKALSWGLELCGICLRIAPLGDEQLHVWGLHVQGMGNWTEEQTAFIVWTVHRQWGSYILNPYWFFDSLWYESLYCPSSECYVLKLLRAFWLGLSSLELFASYSCKRDLFKSGLCLNFIIL